MADISMVFVGDTYVQRPDPDSAFKLNMEYFHGADILFCNLETVVADEQHVPADDPSDGPGNGPPQLSAPHEAADIVELMQGISTPFGTAFQVGKEEVRVVLKRSPEALEG